MKTTNSQDSEYFHKVVDYQHACPEHRSVLEYICTIGVKRYTEANMVNLKSNRTHQGKIRPRCLQEYHTTKSDILCTQN